MLLLLFVSLPFGQRIPPVLWVRVIHVDILLSAKLSGSLIQTKFIYAFPHVYPHPRFIHLEKKRLRDRGVEGSRRENRWFEQFERVFAEVRLVKMCISHALYQRSAGGRTGVTCFCLRLCCRVYLRLQSEHALSNHYKTHLLPTPNSRGALNCRFACDAGRLSASGCVQAAHAVVVVVSDDRSSRSRPATPPPHRSVPWRPLPPLHKLLTHSHSPPTSRIGTPPTTHHTHFWGGALLSAAPVHSFFPFRLTRLGWNGGEQKSGSSYHATRDRHTPLRAGSA